jgi:hypothetical protein
VEEVDSVVRKVVVSACAAHHQQRENGKKHGRSRTGIDSAEILGVTLANRTVRERGRRHPAKSARTLGATRWMPRADGRYVSGGLV